MARAVLMVTSVLLFLLGIAAVFAPHEILNLIGMTTSAMAAAIIQLWGAAELGLAANNWMAKGNAIGGIYGRPLIIGNLLHFTVAAFTVGRLWAEQPQPALVAATVSYALLAGAFAWLAFGAQPPSLPRIPEHDTKAQKSLI